MTNNNLTRRACVFKTIRRRDIRDDDTVVAGPEAWFKNSPWGTPMWGAPGYRLRRKLEHEAYSEQQGEARSVPAPPDMTMMAEEFASNAALLFEFGYGPSVCENVYGLKNARIVFLLWSLWKSN